MNRELNAQFSKAKRWRVEAERLRQTLLSCGLEEELKWRQPCYVFEGKNIAIIQRMNDFLALMFFKGALLKDRQGVLHKPGASSRVGRRFQFTSVSDVVEMENTVKAYVREAVDIERAGLKVDKNVELALPPELQRRLDKDRKLKAAFESLTPGRQRGYSLYVSGAKQATTREARIDKCLQKILDGKGLRD